MIGSVGPNTHTQTHTQTHTFSVSFLQLSWTNGNWVVFPHTERHSLRGHGKGQEKRHRISTYFKYLLNHLLDSVCVCNREREGKHTQEMVSQKILMLLSV